MPEGCGASLRYRLRTGIGPVRARVCGVFLVTLIGLSACRVSSPPLARFPEPVLDASLAAKRDLEAAVFAGGCFWGVEAVFEHVKGVVNVVSGYSGGSAATASYALVSRGATEHAESVHVLYDRAQISYGQLLKIFFAVAHDPTQLNRQGPDRGTQYRSAIFYTSLEQQRIASGYIGQLENAEVFKGRIVTALAPLMAFHEAEAYHQDYASRHPDQLYILLHDAPKVARLKSACRACMWRG
ncbi:MAG: peptide-methionine (S)-S-oxide reductase MsrA [Gammaproteobacteria bacterium]|nr:peptide-methionine (S)-S-oxide reductase MsrA [Gammaproteobacteria bacterium]